MIARRFDWFQKKEIPFRDDPSKILLTRWKLIDAKRFGVFVHRLESDDIPVLHDHPWSFLAIVLRGGYVEARRDPITGDIIRRTVQRINRVRRDDAHYIAGLLRQPTWTLVFVGRTRRAWGFIETSGGTASWTRWDAHGASAPTDLGHRI